MGQSVEVTALPPDYDSDPQRWKSWTAPQDVHEIVAPEIRGPVLDIGCGDGRLPSLLGESIHWIGVDSSPVQVRANPFRPIVLGDMRHLPFTDKSFAEVTHLWCLYHLDDPRAAILEAKRVLQPGGRYFACTAARDSDFEILPEGYPPSTFDAEDAEVIVGPIFDTVEVRRWDGFYFPLSSRDEVRAYCRHNSIPMERADRMPIPLWLTKRGVLVRGAKER
jgi:SAM-dependent methyltransferase